MRCGQQASGVGCAGIRDVVIQPTKQGFVFFVLDRDEPVWPVDERKVPQGAVEGEQLSPTQPFPTRVRPLPTQRFRSEDLFKLGNASCAASLAPLRNDGLFTPPTTQG